MAEKNSLSVGKTYDLVGITSKWAFYLPIPFWIIVFYFDLLEKLFPSYKGKELVTPTFFIPILMGIIAGAVSYVCLYIIYEKFEKGHYQSIGFRREPTLNELLFGYRSKRLYGKLLVAVIDWLSVLILAAASPTIIFGLFIAFKYLRT